MIYEFQPDSSDSETDDTSTLHLVRTSKRYRSRLSSEVISRARSLAGSRPDLPIGGSEGIAQILRNEGEDVSDRQLQRLQKRGWQHSSASGPPVVFSVDDLALLVEIALNHPTIHKQDLAHNFLQRTGRQISETHAWRVARAVLRYEPCLRSPQLSRPHFALREQYHMLLLRIIDSVARIFWTDETYFCFNPVPGRSAFCLSLDDSRRNLPVPKEYKKVMFHGAVSLEWGGLLPHIFPPDTMMNECIYNDLMNVKYRPWLEAHPAAIWQQDNALPHVSASAREVLRTLRRLAFWPPNSPDYNPIEFVWGAMKKALYKVHFNRQEDLLAALLEEWRHQTHPQVFRGHLNRALDNLDRSRDVGYTTVH